MWDLPGPGVEPGIEPVSSAMAGGFFTIRSPGLSYFGHSEQGGTAGLWFDWHLAGGGQRMPDACHSRVSHRMNWSLACATGKCPAWTVIPGGEKPAFLILYQNPFLHGFRVH